jgi:Tol biopolymer transport system component
VKKFDRSPSFFGLFYSPDGRALMYPKVTNGVLNLWSQPIDGGPSTAVTSFTTGDTFGFALSRDGKQLAVARGTVTNDAVLVSNLTPPAR